jgi:hypothetical protein|tara:strand:+ start:372 stop:539 length:168 start_codon:yes stop_codon:yes gene_type:complete
MHPAARVTALRVFEVIRRCSTDEVILSKLSFQSKVFFEKKQHFGYLVINLIIQLN